MADSPGDGPRPCPIDPATSLFVVPGASSAAGVLTIPPRPHATPISGAPPITGYRKATDLAQFAVVAIAVCRSQSTARDARVSMTASKRRGSKGWMEIG